MDFIENSVKVDAVTDENVIVEIDGYYFVFQRVIQNNKRTVGIVSQYHCEYAKYPSPTEVHDAFACAIAIFKEHDAEKRPISEEEEEANLRECVKYFETMAIIDERSKVQQTVFAFA